MWTNATLLAPAGVAAPAPGRGALVAEAGRIVALGDTADLPATLLARAEVVDCGGRLVTPGLIDCHTHLVHAGDRADEFERRLAGASYAEIAAAGGGIMASVRAVRAADEDALVAAALPRLDRLAADGVTTVEMKSGYGLDLDAELRMLAAARRLGRERPVRVVTSFLGAHAVPAERRDDRAAYVRDVVERMLPAVAAAGLADAVDAFLETVAFDEAEVRAVFDAARRLGLPVKLHADQLSDGGGAALAAAYGALSADHLEYTGEAGAAAMAKAGTVAVLLPGAYYLLRETRRPPVEAFRRHGVPMAVATDCNPGTSPLTSLLFAMNMAATLFGLTVAECLDGVTTAAARALGLSAEIGALEPGKRADLAIWNATRPAELVYHLGADLLHSRVFGGRADRPAARATP
nr:imidazolonepropionase [Oharaeibacter diazotrophicus]